jgi:leader peptidase (prepilin peptidase) / N-methyltransferase
MEPGLIDMLWFRLLAGLITGLALGSFITMLSYRLPRRLSIISPPSRCPQCHTNLKIRDLVPVLSWLMERGHCRYCHRAISRRYLVIELTTALAVMGAFWVFGFTPHLIAALFGIVSFIALVAINIERHKNSW